MKKPKLRELGEAMRALFGGPYTTKFPFEPSPAAPRFRGALEFIEDKCMGCGACVEVCPAAARDIIDDKDKKIRRITHYRERCIYCGQCVSACPTEALKHTTEYEMARLKREGWEDSIEKKLVLCEMCGEVITTKEQLLWIAKKAGELAYDNPNLYLMLSRELGLAEPTALKKPSTKPIPYRSGHLQMLCPKCRRSVYLHEIWGY